MDQAIQRRTWRTRLETAGLSQRQERRFNRVATVFLLTYVGVWTFTIVQAVREGKPLPLVSGALASTEASTPAASYLLASTAKKVAEAPSYRGISGAVNVVVQTPGEPVPAPEALPEGAKLVYAPATAPPNAAATPTPQGTGVWRMMVQVGSAVTEVPGVNVITTVPMSEKRSGRIGSYLVGSWPFEQGGARSAAYAPPRGFVRVTPADLKVPISKHITLGEYLTKGQANVWPKYVALVPRALDKVELTIQQLQKDGVNVTNIGVISAFRTPSYNAGGGNTGGRGALSRHMYGDAVDWYVDSNRDGRMDDLNGDGRVNKDDARVIGRAAEKVEKQYPEMIGGIGIYSPTGAHSGFVHLDTRGSRARW